MKLIQYSVYLENYFFVNCNCNLDYDVLNGEQIDGYFVSVCRKQYSFFCGTAYTRIIEIQISLSSLFFGIRFLIPSLFALIFYDIVC